MFLDIKLHAHHISSSGCGCRRVHSANLDAASCTAVYDHPRVWDLSSETEGQLSSLHGLRCLHRHVTTRLAHAPQPGWSCCARQHRVAALIVLVQPDEGMCVQPEEAGEAKERPSVRASTVDNFQGEEARIILASLVRSNAEGKCGFLAEPQRVNVLLSRARDGLILFGNSRCLLGRTGIQSRRSTVMHLGRANSHEPLSVQKLIYPPADGSHDRASAWKTVLARLPIVHGFPARCVRHGRETLLQKPSDFAALTPHGGCTERCGQPLPCGHPCRAPCHAAHLPHGTCGELVACMYAPASLPARIRVCGKILPCVYAPASPPARMHARTRACAHACTHAPVPAQPQGGRDVSGSLGHWRSDARSSEHRGAHACRCAAGLHSATRPCGVDDVPNCGEEVAEVCAAGEHVVWRVCCQERAPRCMRTVYTACNGMPQCTLLPAGETHVVAHRCCEPPPPCMFCKQARQQLQDLAHLEEEQARCAPPLTCMPRARCCTHCQRGAVKGRVAPRAIVHGPAICVATHSARCKQARQHLDCAWLQECAPHDRTGMRRKGSGRGGADAPHRQGRACSCQ
jgi:hypothetical protein